MKKQTGLIIGIILMISCGMVSGGLEFSIKPAGFPVLNGEVQATIVYCPSDSGYTITAYQELQKFLNQATGKNFALMTESEFNSSGRKLPIYVGNCTATTQAIGTQLASVDRDGFMIVVEPKRIFIVGPKDYSTYWGVLQFLEDYVGVRWLMPGPLGEDVAPQSQITISPIRRIEQPVILSREWSGHTLATFGADWTMRMRVQHRYNFHHNFTEIFYNYWPAHPEYYAWNGGRVTPVTSHTNMCLTQPETVTVAAQAARDAFTADPTQESFSFAPDDGMTVCACSPTSPSPATHSAPYCSQLIVNTPYPNTTYWNTFQGKASLSDWYYQWLDKVEENLKTTHPTKIVGCESYVGYAAWPLNVTIENSNIMPYMCHTTADMYVPQYRSTYTWMTDEWSSRCKQVGYYDYAYGHGFVHPRMYASLIQQELQYAVPKRLKGIYAEEYPNWGLDAQRLYMTAKLWWNPYIDRQAVQDDWINRMFKEAAAPMKSHFERCENAWVSYDGYSREPTVIRLGAAAAWSPWVMTVGGKTSAFEVFTPEICEASTANFDQAAALAKTQPVKDRLQFFRKTWNLSLVFSNAYWAGEGLNSYIARGCTLSQAANALKKMPNSYDRSYFLGEITNRMGMDITAFYPIWGSESDISGWANDCVPKPASVSDYQWVGNQLANEALTYPQAQRKSYIDTRINTLFGTGLNANLQRVVDLIHNMAYDQSGVYPVIPQGNLLGYYQFNETSGNIAQDTSGNNLMATLCGDINDTQWVNDTTRGHCLYLDGNKAYVYFGTFGKNITNALSISCWTKTDDVTRGTGFIQGMTTSGSQKLNSYLPVNNGTPSIVWNGGDAYQQMVVDCSIIGYTTALNNTWNHWVFTKDGVGGQLKLYLNGALKSTYSGGPVTYTDIASICIGTSNNAYFKGHIDDVSFWNKVLTGADVTTLFTIGIDFGYSPPILWYKLNDRARNTATNFSEAGIAYNGTFNSPPPAPTWVWGTDQRGTSTWTLSFDGASNYINVPPAVLSQISDKITVTFWQKGNTGAQCDLFHAKKADDSVILSSKLPWVNGGNYVTWDAGGPLDTISKTANVSNYTGTWNHWALTKNATTGQQKIYLNGTLWHSGTNKTSPMSGGSSIQIGTGPDGYYSGLISDFRIYNIEVNSEGVGKIYSGQY